MFKAATKSIRLIAKKTVLQGPVLKWWSLKRAHQVDDIYLKIIARESSVNARERNDSPASRLLPINTPLRRILCIGDFMWERDQMIPELEKIARIDLFDLHPHLESHPDPRTGVRDALSKFTESEQCLEPDIILLYLRPSLLSEDLFTILRSRWSCPLLGLNLDDRVEFFPYHVLHSGNDDYACWISKFDLNLTSSRTALDWYRRRHANVEYFPQGFRPDPRYLTPPSASEILRQFSFVGSWKPERGRLIEILTRHDLAPVLYGNGWKGGRWIEDPASVFRSTGVNLGIGYASASARIANAKGRDVECPGIGSCYLTTYHWELSEMFEIGREVLAYRSIDELIEMLTYFLKRPDECLAIARAAHRRAHAEHTWEKRWRDLFRKIGFQPVTE